MRNSNHEGMMVTFNRGLFLHVKCLILMHDFYLFFIKRSQYQQQPNTVGRPSFEDFDAIYYSSMFVQRTWQARWLTFKYFCNPANIASGDNKTRRRCTLQYVQSSYWWGEDNTRRAQAMYVTGNGLAGPEPLVCMKALFLPLKQRFRALGEEDRKKKKGPAGAWTLKEVERTFYGQKADPRHFWSNIFILSMGLIRAYTCFTWR